MLRAENHKTARQSEVSVLKLFQSDGSVLKM